MFLIINQILKIVFLILNYHDSDNPVHGTRGPKYGNAHKDGHEIGNDAHRCIEPILGTLDKGIVDVDLAEEPYQYEQDDNAHEQHIGGHLYNLLKQGRVYVGPDKGRYQQASATQRKHEHPVEQVDALEDGSDEQAHHRGEECG